MRNGQLFHCQLKIYEKHFGLLTADNTKKSDRRRVLGQNLRHSNDNNNIDTEKAYSEDSNEHVCTWPSEK
jgi:hypothetical protein